MTDAYSLAALNREVECELRGLEIPPDLCLREAPESEPQIDRGGGVETPRFSRGHHHKRKRPAL